MIYKVWIQIEEIDEDKDNCVNIGPPHEAGRFDTEKTARRFVKKELTAAQIAGSAADLLDACESLTSYVMDLLYKLDDQVDLSDIEEIQQARVAIERYNSNPIPNATLRDICRLGLQFLDTLPDTELTTESENREWFRKMLNDGLSNNSPAVDDSCPKCGASHAEREFTDKNFLDIEAIHMRYICNKCGSEIIEEFTLSDVFIDNPPS